MNQQLRRGRVWQRAAQLTAATLAIAGVGASGCLTRPLQPEETRTTSTVVARLTETAVDKIDLLLMIDNSRSMADKQQILVEAVPDLVTGLVNPKCVDPANPTDQTKWVTPSGPTDMCPTGLKRDFNPVLDIHIGIVSSSIGGHGSDACPNSETFTCPGGAANTTNNDMGHLVSRKDSCSGGAVKTYKGSGFLAWDPKNKYMEPGETQAAIGSLNINTATGQVTDGTPGLVVDLKDMVLGTGQIGCGYEASIEAWYRFLVDPDPYESIKLDGSGKATPDGIDQTLLTQRADFLRPSSLLAIIGLTDENDCSIKEYGQFYYAAQQRDPSNSNKNFYLPKPRSECATDPNNACCRSCGQDQTGCPADSNCNGSLDSQTDDVNLRCWDQKRRFGIDFLYPIDRYVTGLQNTLVPNRAGDMVPNPIFSDLNTSDSDSNIRDSSLVFLAYIVGVPWQDIARDPNDLTKGFKNATEMSTPDGNNHNVWDYIIGDPSAYVQPLDPHMIESWAPRMGTNPITGDAISPPAKSEGGPDKLNGHEYTPGTAMGVQKVADDLEYACIFKLPQPRDCSDSSVLACDCNDPLNDNPLCADNGTKGRTLQTHAKGYPGVRQLSLIKALGSQGIVGSICPAQLDDLNKPDFGYRPAIGAIIDRLKVALGGQCLPRKLSPQPNGQVQCLILEARNTGGMHKNDCDAFCDMQSGRRHIQDDNKPAVTAAQEDPIAKASGWDCFCEIKQLEGVDGSTAANDCHDGSAANSPLSACQCDSSDPPTYNGNAIDGWCYVDGTTIPTTGNKDIVKNCQPTERRLVRFVGNGNPTPGATVFITCAGE